MTCDKHGTKRQNDDFRFTSVKVFNPVALLAKLYKVVLSFESVDEILKCDH